MTSSQSRLPPLARMRSYTTWSLVSVVVLYSAGVALGSQDPFVRIGVLVLCAPLTWQAVRWERGLPLPAAVAVVAATLVFWCLAVARHDPGFAAVSYSLGAGLITTSPRLLAWRWSWLAVVLSALPQLAAGRLPITGIVLTGVGIGIFRVNLFAFGLYLEIDRARTAESGLAVAEERYRFAADLHDIQGQALHVSRLELRVADRLLETDPHQARAHLRKAEELIGDTIAATRGLAYGTRSVTLAGEVANSLALLRAASIAVKVGGEPPVGHRCEELFAILVRETTTNLLRHAQVTAVRITFGPGSVSVVNDGASQAPRELSGLARLADRFTAAGGTLSASREGSSFTTSAVVP